MENSAKPSKQWVCGVYSFHRPLGKIGGCVKRIFGFQPCCETLLVHCLKSGENLLEVSTDSNGSYCEREPLRLLPVVVLIRFFLSGKRVQEVGTDSNGSFCKRKTLRLSSAA